MSVVYMGGVLEIGIVSLKVGVVCIIEFDNKILGVIDRKIIEVRLIYIYFMFCIYKVYCKWVSFFLV